MNLRSVDLNLLVLLDALLDESHVSRAACRLGLSQPALSNALERCRYLFKDRLLERGRGEMKLTAKAESLRVPLKNLLAEIEGLFSPAQVDLQTIKQTVRLIVADLPGTLLVQPLLRLMADTAPGLLLAVHPWQGAPAALESLLKGDVDLAVSVFPDADEVFQVSDLLLEHYQVVMRKDHPAVAGFSLQQWLAYPHVFVSGKGDVSGVVDQALARQGLFRQIGVVVPSFQMVPSLLLDSDLIAMLPSRCVPADTVERYACFEPPIEVPGFPLHLAWHKRRSQDKAVQHVVTLIHQILGTVRP